MSFKQQLKKLVFGLIGKDPEAVVVSFLSGGDNRAAAMLAEVRTLLPDRRHFAVSTGTALVPEGVELVILPPASTGELWLRLRRIFRNKRIGMAPVLLGDEGHADLRRAALILAPRKALAFNPRGERHHLRLRTAMASLLFLRGVPLDRIWLRPRWLFPWKRDRSEFPAEHHRFDGRPTSPLRPRVAVLSPYLPWPLAHGGAVRIFNLLREAAKEFDLYLFAFVEDRNPPDPGPLTEFCANILTVPKPRYREPRWSTIRPAEVSEYSSPEMRSQLDAIRREEGIRLTQVEYTQLASYRGEILVEHDVTFDLYQQIHQRAGTASSRWDWWRWQRFERAAVKRYQRVVVMSAKDRQLLDSPHAGVIANGVDLERYVPSPEPEGRRLLFIGSFRHFPNIVAYRYLVERIFPAARSLVPKLELTVVSGPDSSLHWQNYAGTPEPPVPEGVRLLQFVSDVRPLYHEANLVVVPTLESAGTNIKVLEAMAMARTVISTPSGCAGLGLEHGQTVWIADSPGGFAAGIHELLGNSPRRHGIAIAARQLAGREFDWKILGERQRELFRALGGPGLVVRPATSDDLETIGRIQASAPEASQWNPESYLEGDCCVADLSGEVIGFIAGRRIEDDEYEVLNLVTAPEQRRKGVARLLIRNVLGGFSGRCFLEVRESNVAARSLYGRLGFEPIRTRRNYYRNPNESAIEMAFQSC